MNVKCALGVIAAGLLSATALAQTNLHGWHANGQTWLVWTDNQTFTGAQTYDVYVSTSPITNLGSASLTGRLFPGDWKATRLKRAGAGLRWTIPAGGGGTYTLADNESLFVYTPHAAVPEYFAVVKNGNTVVASGMNSLAAPIAQMLAPVTCYPQNTGTSSGQAFTDYAFWLDGRANYDSSRADFPVMGNQNFNGVACLFRVFDPPGGVPAGLLPAVLVLHGHGGAWNSGGPAPTDTYMDKHLTNGLAVNLDDHQFSYDGTNVTGDGPGVIDSETRWFGYWKDFDRFSSVPRTATKPPDGSLVVPYTLRRNAWIVDWLIAHRSVDSHRVALMGHSMGGAGVSINVRFTPEKYCAAVAYEGPTVSTDNDLGIYMQGTQTQNLPTPLTGAPGVADVYNPGTVYSSNDYPIVKFVWGVNDTTVAWSPSRPTLINGIGASTRGAHVYWDERTHQNPWSGHWCGTPRLKAQWLVRYRNDQSFPAFSNESGADSDPTVAVPGSSTAKNWGTKGGYYDWDVDSISDTPIQWACTLSLVNASTFNNDVPSFATSTADVTIRRSQHFRPANGTPLAWEYRRVADNALLACGSLTVATNGEVTVPGLTIYQSTPARLTVNSAGSAVGTGFQVSYQAGTIDGTGQFMGGTEFRLLAAHKGRLYGGLETWMDTIPTGSTDPAIGAQIVRLDAPQDPWRLDYHFDETIPGGSGRKDYRNEGVTALKSVTFTTDKFGRPLAQPVTILLAACRDFLGLTSVYTRDDTNGSWTETVIAPVSNNGKATIRSFALYRDQSTGADRVFAGALPTGIFSGVYDPSLPGKIAWDTNPELVGFSGRPMAFAVCNGSLHAAIAPDVWMRVDGQNPPWVKVFTYNLSVQPGGSSGLRGLTTVPNPAGPGESLLAAGETGSYTLSGQIVRLDTHTIPYTPVIERNVIADLTTAFGYAAKYVVVANSDMTSLPDPANGMPALAITVQHHPAAARRDAFYYLRRANGANITYELRRIDNTLLNPALPLNSTRACALSPFPADGGSYVYFGGYDADENPSHNTAYALRSSLATVLFGNPDSVGDGVPDWWRAIFFGGDGKTADSVSSATSDPDRDGMDNYHEYLANSDPLDTQSYFYLTNFVKDDVGFTVWFQSTLGRKYTLYYSTDLTMNIWNPVPSQTDIFGSGGVDPLTDPSPTDRARFYRVSVDLP